MTKLQALTATALLTGASLAMAHPGHGHTDAGSLLHYLLEPLHLVVAAVVVVAAVILALRVRGSRTRAKHRLDE